MPSGELLQVDDDDDENSRIKSANPNMCVTTHLTNIDKACEFNM